VDDEVVIGDIGAAIWFSGWVKLNSDNQCLMSLSNDTNTNLVVSAGVLTAGATLTLAGIRVDDVSKTASEAGVLLNDNAWHFLSCGIGDGLGGASTADDVRMFTDGTAHGSLSGFDWRFWSVTPTAAELTECYSGSGSRNAAALSKLAGWHKMDEQSGVVSYDSSGNGNSGTITNATLANFHTTQDIYSFQNQVGYNLDTGVFIPRDESDTANDVLGDPLQYTGRRPNDAALINSNCVTLNGTDQAVRVADNTDLDITDNLTVSVWAKNDNATLAGVEALSSKWDSGVAERSWGFFINTDKKIDLRIGNAEGSVAARELSDAAIDPSGLHQYAFTFEAGTVKLYFDGSLVASTLSGAGTSVITSFAIDLMIGSELSADVISAPWDGQILDARIYAGDSTVLTDAQILSIYENPTGNINFDGQTLAAHCRLAEGAGVAGYDSSGNGNHGTIENAVSNWGATQDIVHSNLLNGFSLYEHASSDPLRVPFDSTGNPISISPPTGYTLTGHRPAGAYHNDAETKIDFNPDSTPEMGVTQLGITVPAAHGFGDVFADSDQVFSRQRTATEDRFLVMTEAQIGSGLAIVENYTQP
jgi:hypothetical protein